MSSSPSSRPSSPSASPDVEIVGHEVFGNLHGADETELLAQLPGELQERDVDAVVSGMGC